jgi:hypothetical protein
MSGPVGLTSPYRRIVASCPQTPSDTSPGHRSAREVHAPISVSSGKVGRKTQIRHAGASKLSGTRWVSRAGSAQIRPATPRSGMPSPSTGLQLPPPEILSPARQATIVVVRPTPCRPGRKSLCAARRRRGRAHLLDAPPPTYRIDVLFQFSCENKGLISSTEENIFRGSPRQYQLPIK